VAWAPGDQAHQRIQHGEDLERRESRREYQKNVSPIDDLLLTLGSAPFSFFIFLERKLIADTAIVVRVRNDFVML